MIRACGPQDLDTIGSIINDGALAYKGVIPEDRCREPYMSANQLKHEIGEGVVFWGHEEDRDLAGVMGIQERGT